MKQSNDAKPEVNGVHLDDAALARAEGILRRMLATPPKPHEEMTAKKPTKPSKKSRK